MKKKIGVLVSGGGTNLQALIDAQKAGKLTSGEIALVISSKPGAYALERAEKAGITAISIDKKAYESRSAFEDALIKELQKHEIDFIVLAGFMLVLSDAFIRTYPDRIINVHPALIPSFCGDGFYGLHVHEKALEYGVKVTGATVHFVNEITDGGAIILQKAVSILEDDTPETLQQRVMKEAEHIILPEATELLCAGKLERNGRRVIIKDARYSQEEEPESKQSTKALVPSTSPWQKIYTKQPLIFWFLDKKKKKSEQQDSVEENTNMYV